MGRFRAPGQDGQSHWLVLATGITDRDQDAQIPNWKREILLGLPGRRKETLHFRELDHGARLFAAQCICEKRIGFLTVLAHKPAISLWKGFAQKRQPEKNMLYKYLLRLLIEKITDTIARICARQNGKNEKVKLVFSRRGGMDYADFRSYMEHLRNLQQRGGAYHPIWWEHLDLDAMEATDHSLRAGLQIADVCASSFFHAVEPNRYGMTEARYAQILRPRLIPSRTQEVLYYGVKPVPDLGSLSLAEDQRAFFRSWKKDG
jgi:hypothetical protein